MTDVSVGGIRPIDGFVDIAVYNRVVMDITDMVSIIALAANPVFPKAALPDVMFAK